MAIAVGISRTSLYVQHTTQSSKDINSIQELTIAHSHHPRYGVRRLALYLGWSINKTRRIRCAANISAIRNSKKYHKYNRQASDIDVPINHLANYALFKDKHRPQAGMTYSNMTSANAWAQDFTYLRIRSGMYYLALVLNLETREILSWKLGTNHSSSLTHIALIQALRTNTSPDILHSDRGSEYLSQRHATTCIRFGIQISASKPGSPWQNGFMERCIKSVKEELGSLNQYQDLDELYIGITNAIAYYNNHRIHTALKMSPRDYAKSIKTRKFKLNSVFRKVGA